MEVSLARKKAHWSTLHPASYWLVDSDRVVIRKIQEKRSVSGSLAREGMSNLSGGRS